MVNKMQNKLKGISMVSILIHATIGIRIITLPRDVTKYAKNDAWLSVIVMYFVLLATAYSFYWVSSQYTGLNYSQINEVVLGKIIGKLMLVVIGVYIISTIGLSLRVFAESIRLFLLDRTPMNIIMIIMIFTAMLCLKSGIKTISIIFDILLPVFILFIIFLITLPIKATDPKNLLPILHNGIKPVFRGAIEIVDPVLGCGIIGYVLPYIEEVKKKRMIKYIFIGISVTCLFYLAIMLLVIMVFGTNEIQYLMFPTITIYKAIALQTQVFERAEALFMTAWIPTTFTTICVYYLAGFLNLKVLVNTKKDKNIIYILMAIVMIIANIPKDMAEMFKYLEYNAVLAQVLNLVYVPVFTSIVLYKVKRGKKYGKQKN
jgi:spore germination protein (amino acid permease)